MNEWWKQIPVCINNSYGDPFTDIQIMDTFDKVKKLYTEDMHFCICTKAVPSKEAWDIIEQMGNISKNNMILEYSLTGLNEGGFTFEERKETIIRLHQVFKQMAIMLRPLIAEKNDSDVNLRRIIDVASITGKKIIIGGIHDENKRKQFNVDTIQKITKMCNEAGVNYFFKTSCTAANQFGVTCWVHDLGEPQNLDVAASLGYEIYLFDDENDKNKLVVREATTGDLNFLRLLTGAKIYCEKLINNYNLLSFSREDIIFECTSSWFSWSNNVPCSIACDYCIIRSIGYLLKNRTIGCFPKELPRFYDVKKKKAFEEFSPNIRAKRIVSENIKLTCYEDLRTIQVCEAHQS